MKTFLLFINRIMPEIQPHIQTISKLGRVKVLGLKIHFAAEACHYYLRFYCLLPLVLLVFLLFLEVHLQLNLTLLFMSLVSCMCYTR